MITCLSALPLAKLSPTMKVSLNSKMKARSKLTISGPRNAVHSVLVTFQGVQLLTITCWINLGTHFLSMGDTKIKSANNTGPRLPKKLAQTKAYAWLHSETWTKMQRWLHCWTQWNFWISALLSGVCEGSDWRLGSNKWPKISQSGESLHDRPPLYAAHLGEGCGYTHIMICRIHLTWTVFPAATASTSPSGRKATSCTLHDKPY